MLQGWTQDSSKCIWGIDVDRNVFLVVEFEKLNPIKYVPALVDGDAVIADSFAILLVRHEKSC